MIFSLDDDAIEECGKGNIKMAKIKTNCAITSKSVIRWLVDYFR